MEDPKANLGPTRVCAYTHVYTCEMPTHMHTRLTHAVEKGVHLCMSVAPALLGTENKESLICKQ